MRDIFNNIKGFHMFKERTDVPIMSLNGIEHNYQWFFKFDNGSGASVIQNGIAYVDNIKEFEIAEIEWNKDGRWNLVFTDICQDGVLGHCSFEEILEVLNKIESK